MEKPAKTLCTPDGYAKNKPGKIKLKIKNVKHGSTKLKEWRGIGN